MPVTAWDPTPYPDPRRNRIPRRDFGEDVPVPAIRHPRTYLWSLRMRETTQNEQAVAASRRILGPAVIKDVTGIFIHPSATAVVLPIFGLYWNTAPYVSVSGQPAGTRILGVSLWELTRVADDGLALSSNQGITAFPGNTVTQVRTYPLNYVITDAECYLAALLEHRANSGESIADASVMIYENCDAADLAALLA